MSKCILLTPRNFLFFYFIFLTDSRIQKKFILKLGRRKMFSYNWHFIHVPLLGCLDCKFVQTSDWSLEKIFCLRGYLEQNEILLKFVDRYNNCEKQRSSAKQNFPFKKTLCIMYLKSLPNFLLILRKIRWTYFPKN